MPLETVTHISDLNPANPSSADPKSEGDNHIRNLKSALKTDFPNVAGPVTASHTELSHVQGVTSPIQAQLNAKPNKTGDTWTGTHDFTGATLLAATPVAAANPATKAYVDAAAFSAALPGQAGNAGKFVTTDGVTASWASVNTTPFSNNTALAQVQAMALCF